MQVVFRASFQTCFSSVLTVYVNQGANRLYRLNIIMCRTVSKPAGFYAFSPRKKEKPVITLFMKQIIINFIRKTSPNERNH